MLFTEHAGTTISVEPFPKGKAGRDPFVKITVHNAPSIRLPPEKIAAFIEQCIRAKWEAEGG